MKRVIAVGMVLVLLFALVGCRKEETMDLSYDAANFLDRAEATLLEQSGVQTVEVVQVDQNCLFAKGVDASLEVYKINTSDASKYCVGDRLQVSYESCYYAAKKNRYELDPLLLEYAMQQDEMMLYKPVIYLYPEQETEISVRLELDGEFTVTEPLYEDGWSVLAKPNGTLIHQGVEYPYLFWEAKTDITFDMSRGFCVAAEETEGFLKEKLLYLGLNARESAEFMEFWLPKMQQNPYNLIAF